MCGIAGIVSDNLLEKRNILIKMVNSLHHRGPDDKGFYISDSCGLGHSRLSIIDLDLGRQPMMSPDDELSIVFNGEIYGYRDILNSTTNYTFRSSSDTEVILYLYEKFGKNFLQRLPGMFSFAIWNKKERELFCARDRFGEKPFYYSLTNDGTFIFSSEIKAILRAGIVKPEINENSLVHYLQKLYINPSKTIYKNIETLSPAHYLIFKDGKISVNRYWNLPESNLKIEYQEACDEFRKLLIKSVQNQLIADVEVGTFLSGGIDSTTITGIASRLQPKTRTFSFSFEKSNNEFYYSRIASNHFSTLNTELTDTQYSVAELMLEMANVFDEPLADSSTIPSYLISKSASQYIKVVLTGDGADELLGGYRWYNNLLGRDWKEKRKYEIFTLEKASYISQKLFKRKIHGFHSIIDDNIALADNTYYLRAHNKQYLFFSDAEIEAFGLAITKPDFSYEFVKGTIDDVLRKDILNYLPGNILTKIDRVSMANSLELRAPFLDVELAEFCISLPWQFKLNRSDNKIILKETFKDLLPQVVINRNKQGFGAPVENWLKLKDVVDLKQSYLLDKSRNIYSFLKFKQCEKYFNSDSYQTWILLVLSIWIENLYQRNLN